MPEPAPPRPRRRRWPYALLAIALLGGATALALRHYTRPEQVTALLVAQTHELLGAELVIHGEARYGVLPKLRAILPKPALRLPGAATPFVRADALEVVLPWRNLWADRYEIERLELVRPVLDLDALAAWLATRPPSQAAPPQVRFAVHLDGGTVVKDGQPLARGVNLRFASAGDLAAWLERWRAQPDTAPLLPPLAGSADAAEIQFGETRLEGVHVELRDDGAPH